VPGTGTRYRCQVQEPGSGTRFRYQVQVSGLGIEGSAPQSEINCYSTFENGKRKMALPLYVYTSRAGADTCDCPYPIDFEHKRRDICRDPDVSYFPEFPCTSRIEEIIAQQYSSTMKTAASSPISCRMRTSNLDVKFTLTCS